MSTFGASSSSSTSGLPVPSPGGEPSPMESFLDSDLILHLIGILGFKECVRRLCMLNKKSYKTVLNVFLVHTKQKGPLSALAKGKKKAAVTGAEVYRAKPLEASARRYCHILDVARTLTFQLNAVKLSSQAKQAVQMSGSIQILRTSPDLMLEMGTLNDGMLACWHSLPSDPKQGIYDHLLKNIPQSDTETHKALAKDCLYWQGSRVHATFIVLFDRPDGTILVSAQDLKSVYLVLGLEQTLGTVANLKSRNGSFVKGPPFKPPKFHAPLLGTRVTTTLLNWDGKIVYDGFMSPEHEPSAVIIKKAVQAYIQAVDTNTLIVALEKKAIAMPKFQGFSSKTEYDRVRNELRSRLEEIKAFPTSMSMQGATWIAARSGCTERENPDHVMCLIGGPDQVLVPEFKMQSISPTVQEYVEILYNGARTCRNKPQGFAIDCEDRLEMMRGILEPATGIKVLYFPAPSEEERRICAEEVREEMEGPKGEPKCLVCAAKSCANGSKLLICSRCRKVHYCSKEHQKEHWKKHKHVCAPSGST